MTQAQLSRVRMSSQFLLPAAIFVLGMTVWWRRR
jgi:ABC-type uncharacterized transport system involved in gliding motility auxiliary subunit